jgi:hypothetical protein
VQVVLAGRDKIVGCERRIATLAAPTFPMPVQATQAFNEHRVLPVCRASTSLLKTSATAF